MYIHLNIAANCAELLKCHLEIRSSYLTLIEFLTLNWVVKKEVEN